MTLPGRTQGREGSERRATNSVVAIVAASLEIVGGHSVAAAALCPALRSAGYTVIEVPINPQLPQWLRWVRRVPGLRTAVNQLLYVPSLLKLTRCDVVHVFSASYWSFLLAPVPAILIGRLFRKRVVVHYHSGEASDHLATWGWAVHPWLSLAHEIVVPSEYLVRVFAAHGHSARRVPNLFDADRFTFRERSSLAPHLISTRNLEPIYSVETTVRAFAIVKGARPDATLTIVGSGSEGERLRQLVADLRVEGVRFVGQLPPARMAAALDTADIFLNASVVDNQPLSVLEAFASGLPVVTTRAGAIPEMVRHGETGCLVPSGDPSAMAAAVLELLADPSMALRLAKCARRELEHYAWASVGGAWAAAYGRPTDPDAGWSLAGRIGA
jgi:glycosyltransferase involved in cell wall biosynthesis